MSVLVASGYALRSQHAGNPTEPGDAILQNFLDLTLWRGRFLRVDAKPTWRHPIHEYIPLDNFVTAKIDHPIKHKRVRAQGEQSSRRNLEIFEAHNNDSDYERDARFSYYYGNALRENSCYAKANQAYEKALGLGLCTEDEYHARYHVAENLYELQAYSLAEESLLSLFSENRFEPFSSHRLLRGIICYRSAVYMGERERLEEAAKWLQGWRQKYRVPCRPEENWSGSHRRGKTWESGNCARTNRCANAYAPSGERSLGEQARRVARGQLRYGLAPMSELRRQWNLQAKPRRKQDIYVSREAAERLGLLPGAQPEAAG